MTRVEELALHLFGQLESGDLAHTQIELLETALRSAMREARAEGLEAVGFTYCNMRMNIVDASRQAEVLAGNIVKEAIENGAIAELRGLQTWCIEQAQAQRTREEP
jgi:O-acetyl-ADP-ribose deacetylase (regulator of RNase III)